MENPIGINSIESTVIGGVRLPRFLGEWRMNYHSWIYRFVLLLCAAIVLPVALCAQEAEEAPQGVNRGDYNIQQSIELGYRVSDFSGNTAVYDTFVNLNQGPRLFNQSLQMHSLDHHGLLFDDLYMYSFGYGGDPNDVTRLGISKNKWYDFNGSFRRDRNLWNYDLLANPLNPGTSNPLNPITFSPHLMQMSRRMSDFNLIILPQSTVRFRLGYTRNINEGPSLSSFHSGTDIPLFQNWKTTLNAYQFGVDIKLIPKTNISYDQFLQYYKGDTSYTDGSLMGAFGGYFPDYQLANGLPMGPSQSVDLGLIYDTAGNSPCKTPIANATTPPTVTANCNAMLAYTRSAPTRIKYPVEQLSFQSNPIKQLDLSGRFSYTSSTSDVPNYYEYWNGLARGVVQSATAGIASAKRVSVATDFAATVFVTNKFRIQDEFRFSNFRIPGNFASTATTYAGATLGATLGTPTVASTISSRFLGEDMHVNTLQFLYDFSRRLGMRLGYRHRFRDIPQSDVEFAGGAVTSNVLDDTKIKEDSALMGFWARPTDQLRLTYDMELMYADRSFTRISPRQSQHYKLRTQYKPTNLVHVSATASVYEGRDNVVTIDHRDHNWSLGLDTAIVPNDRWSLDFGYDFNDVFSQTDICFAFTGTPPVSTSVCPIISATGGLEALSTYKNKTHYGFADLMFKPVKRVALNAGYTLTATTGNTVILNPNSPAGPLQYNYHTPYASVKVDLEKGFAWKAGWNFYDYNEKDQPIDLTGPRAFRGNNLNLSVVYSF
jgi:hypothetical protein